MWSTSQRPAQGHHPLSQCLPLTLNLDPQVTLRLRGVTEGQGETCRTQSYQPSSQPSEFTSRFPSLTSPAMSLPPARSRAATSSLSAALTCDDRDRLSSGSDPRESFIQWQKVERGNRVQPILQTLNDCTHQQGAYPDSGLTGTASAPAGSPSHDCQSAVSPTGTWSHLSLHGERGPYLFLAGTPSGKP